MSEYNTKQNQRVLNLIKTQTTDFSAKSIYEKLGGEIGLTTIYRFIESLEKDGVILKISQENNTAKYQYVQPCEHADHFYLKCEKCGKLEHIDCEKIQGLTEHIAKEHHFNPHQTHMIINGACENCTIQHEKKH